MGTPADQDDCRIVSSKKFKERGKKVEEDRKEKGWIQEELREECRVTRIKI